VPFREIAEVIGRHVDVPVVSEDAAECLGLIAYVAGLDNPASSTATRALLAWETMQPRPARGPGCRSLLQ
jgi:hypothetical protein